MSLILPPQQWTRQPQVPVGLAAPYATRGSYSVLANIGTIVGGSSSALTPVGTTAIGAGPGGKATTTSGSTGNYWKGSVIPRLQAGKSSIVVVFSTLEAGTGGADWLAGEVDTSGGYFLDVTVNGNESVNSDGSVGLSHRGNTSGIIRIRTGNVGANDGRVHTVVWLYDSTTTWRCFFDGVEKSLTYDVADTVVEDVGQNQDYALWFHQRNLRDSAQYDGGATLKLYAYAQLTNRLNNPGSVSVNPWQLFAPLPRRIFVGPSGAAGAYTLTAASGTFTLTGQDATLLKSKSLTADVGTYSLTGQDATLTKGRILTADVGTFSLSGQDATLLKSKVLVATVGTFSLTGQDATFNYTGGSTYTLTAAAGTYSLTGQSATLLKTNVLTAAFGSYSLTGQSATLIYSGTPPVVTDPADFTLSFPGGVDQRIGASSESADTIRIGPSSASGSTQRILH